MKLKLIHTKQDDPTLAATGPGRCPNCDALQEALTCERDKIERMVNGCVRCGALEVELGVLHDMLTDEREKVKRLVQAIKSIRKDSRLTRVQ